MNQPNKHKRIFLVLCILLTAIFFSSCNKGEIYYDFKTIKDEKWSKNDTLYFHIDSGMIQPGEKYNISIELSNSANYPYQNIWLYVSDNFRHTVFENKSKQYMLADEFGRWYGSGWGAIYQMSLEYGKELIFFESRDYCIKIVHGMRNEPLEGIEQIGVKIVKSE